MDKIRALRGRFQNRDSRIDPSEGILIALEVLDVANAIVAALGPDGQIDAAEQLFGEGAGSLPTEDATLPVYNRLKVAFLAAASRGDLSADQTEIALDTLHDLKETAHLIDRVCKRIAAIHQAAAGGMEGEPAGQGT